MVMMITHAQKATIPKENDETRLLSMTPPDGATFPNTLYIRDYTGHRQR